MPTHQQINAARERGVGADAMMEEILAGQQQQQQAQPQPPTLLPCDFMRNHLSTPSSLL